MSPSLDASIIGRAVGVGYPVHHPMGSGQELGRLKNHLHTVFIIMQLRGDEGVTVQHENIHADSLLVFIEFVKIIGVFIDISKVFGKCLNPP